MAAQINIQAVAQAFLKHYFTLYDNDRSKLVTLYQKDSILSFDGQTFIGAENINKKYAALQFKKIAHKVVSFDCHPSGGTNGILVFVCGDLKFDDEQNAVKFSQVFHLLPTEPTLKNFYIFNDMFRLNIG